MGEKSIISSKLLSDEALGICVKVTGLEGLQTDQVRGVRGGSIMAWARRRVDCWPFFACGPCCEHAKHRFRIHSDTAMLLTSLAGRSVFQPDAADCSHFDCTCSALRKTLQQQILGDGVTLNEEEFAEILKVMEDDQVLNLLKTSMSLSALSANRHELLRCADCLCPPPPRRPSASPLVCAHTY